MYTLRYLRVIVLLKVLELKMNMPYGPLCLKIFQVKFALNSCFTSRSEKINTEVSHYSATKQLSAASNSVHVYFAFKVG